MTRATGSSVIQVRTQDVFPGASAGLILGVLARHGEALEKGAIVSVDPHSSRVRILPILP